MARSRPTPLTAAQRRARHDRVIRLARSVGFVGRVEYRHVYSQTGGAQYGEGWKPADDLLAVYAEAFERDADPDDFSLEAIVAHERGHQLVARHPQLAERFENLSLAAEEILASVIGAILCSNKRDRDFLLAKAVVELIDHGVAAEEATVRLRALRIQLESLL